eukprot:PLAT1249.1.p1 GENE.PLAT1249.1~~PLAT1249.1.p1  ORF type:complete len:181 (+),score=45.46 PLAT1249.1:63-545(+)
MTAEQFKEKLVTVAVARMEEMLEAGATEEEVQEALERHLTSIDEQNVILACERADRERLEADAEIAKRLFDAEKAELKAAEDKAEEDAEYAREIDDLERQFEDVTRKRMEEWDAELALKIGGPPPPLPAAPPSPKKRSQRARAGLLRRLISHVRRRADKK